MTLDGNLATLKSNSISNEKNLHINMNDLRSTETKDLEAQAMENNLVLVKTKTHYLFILLKIATSSLLGFLFGWAMEKAKVYEPTAIKDQMIFKKFIMLKMFFAALATSTLSILLLSLIFKTRYNAVFDTYRSSLKNKSAFVIVIGASLLGVGMQISGACPGMVLIQLGAGVPWSYITLIGALSGAVLHGILNSYIMRDVKGDPVLSKTAPEFLCNINAVVIRIALIVSLGISVFLMEYFRPWTNEYKGAIVEGSSNILIYKAWPPSTCGILLGALQFFSILFLNKSLGTSSSYSTLAGTPLITKNLQEKFPYLAKFRTGLPNWLTVIFVCSAVLGGFSSSYVSGVFGKSTGIHPYNAFLGGFLMVFGARIAGGCTSGHGISGSSHLFLGSFLAVAAMFGSAIISGFYVFLVQLNYKK